MRQLAAVIVLGAGLWLSFGLVFVPGASAQERVSPKYLWEPTRSISSARLLFCGDPSVPHGSGHRTRVAIYRDMQYRYFTTSNEKSMFYDIPLQISSWEENGRTYFRFRFQRADGKKQTYAEIVSSPDESPSWVRDDGETQVEIPCKSYRFSAEFIPYSRKGAF